MFVWQIALFVSLGENIPAYGGAMALAGLVGAVCGLLLGRHIDAGHGRRAVIIASVMATVLVLLRAASLGSPWLAVIANALGALLWPLLIPALGTGDLQYGKGLPLPFPLPSGDRGRLGHRMLRRLPRRGGAVGSRAFRWAIAILLALPGWRQQWRCCGATMGGRRMISIRGAMADIVADGSLGQSTDPYHPLTKWSRPHGIRRRAVRSLL